MEFKEVFVKRGESGEEIAKKLFQIAKESRNDVIVLIDWMALRDKSTRPMKVDGDSVYTRIFINDWAVDVSNEGNLDATYYKLHAVYYNDASSGEYQGYRMYNKEVSKTRRLYVISREVL